MFKFLLLSSLFLSSSVVWASPMEQIMTIKERLRISLWVEGLAESSPAKPLVAEKKVLPEEIEQALRKL